jgi:hypothetical protein
MLVIRIAIIRIAAAGVVWSRADIWKGMLPPGARAVKHFVSIYIYALILMYVPGGGQKQEARRAN